MYIALVIIFVVLNWVQSYDVFSKDVTIAYGNNENNTKMETSINQLIMKNNKLYPMESYSRGYGKKEMFALADDAI